MRHRPLRLNEKLFDLRRAPSSRSENSALCVSLKISSAALTITRRKSP